MRRNAAGDADVDFAVIRFKIPGFDDLSQLPRIFAAVGLIVMVGNRFVAPETSNGGELRLFTECIGLIVAAYLALVPWMGRRLEEAARRQASAGETAQMDSIQTLAIKSELASADRIEISWVTSVLLRLTNADGLAVWNATADGEVICTRGFLRQMPGFSGGPDSILTALGSQWQPSTLENGYCSTRNGLQFFSSGILPTRVLPGTTQAAIAKPLATGGLLVMWSSKPRAFDRPADRKWIERVAHKLSAYMPSVERQLDVAASETCVEADFPGLALDPAAAKNQSRDPFARFAGEIRLAPAIVGLVVATAVIAVRWSLISSANFETVDPAQSRLDLIVGVLASALVLQGMVWYSETPMAPASVNISELPGVEETARLDWPAGGAVAAELQWMWDAISTCTRVSSMVVFWQDRCVLQAGFFKGPEDEGIAPFLGPLCREVISKGKGRYMAQLANWPAKEQFYGYIPKGTPGLLLTPLRPAPTAPAEGLFVLGVDTPRGLGKVDQAWISALADKLAVSLAQASALREVDS